MKTDEATCLRMYKGLERSFFRDVLNLGLEDILVGCERMKASVVHVLL